MPEALCQGARKFWETGTGQISANYQRRESNSPTGGCPLGSVPNYSTTGSVPQPEIFDGSPAEPKTSGIGRGQNLQAQNETMDDDDKNEALTSCEAQLGTGQMSANYQRRKSNRGLPPTAVSGISLEMAVEEEDGQGHIGCRTPIMGSVPNWDVSFSRLDFFLDCKHRICPSLSI
jgi:hypothetical protein